MKLVLMVALVALVVGVFAWVGFYLWQDTQDVGGDRVCSHGPEECAQLIKSYKDSYEEGKDLSKAFLTLVAAVFVASVTFSEKILDLKSAGSWARASMIVCWIFLLVSIAACGTGLVYLASAYALLNFTNFVPLHQMLRSCFLIGSSGLAFGVGLLMMLLAGLPSVIKKDGVN
jgi:hypothetical protein